jgi:hypothetical protein
VEVVRLLPVKMHKHLHQAMAVPVLLHLSLAFR